MIPRFLIAEKQSEFHITLFYVQFDLSFYGGNGRFFPLIFIDKYRGV